MKQPIVSVIVPAYNAEDTIASALESVLSQSVPPYEAIVVDDGSTDRTGKIVKEISRRDKRVKYIRQKNAGPSAARNRALDAAKGDLVAFCDADDMWKPGKLARQISFLGGNPDVALLGARAGKTKNGCANITFRRLLFGNAFVTSSVVLRRAAIGKLRFNTSQRYSEDYRLWLELAHAHRAAVLGDDLVSYGGGKRGYGASGLSARLRNMEKGELSNFAYVRRKGFVSFPLYAAAVLWSLAKFVRRVLVSAVMPKKKAHDAKTLLFVGNTSFSMYNFRLGVMKSLAADGCRVIVAAPRDSYSDLFAEEGISFEELPMSRKGTNPFGELATLLRLYRLYRRVRPALAFNYTIKPIIYGSVAASAARVKHIAVTTGLGYAFVSSNRFAPAALAARLLYRFSLLFPREVWFLNTEDREIFVKGGIVDAKKTRVIPGEGVDMDHFSPKKKASTKKPAFLLVARIVADKGVRDFVAASRILKWKKVPCECRLLGAFDDYPNAITPDEVAEWEREGAVKYLGVTNDVRGAIAKADCIVLPSAYREGVPRSLMEGASMERPLIATDIAGCRDVVRDGFNGFLCRPRDPESLASAMKRFIDLSAAKRDALGRSGRRMIREEFDETIIAKIYRDVIDDIV